MRRDQMPDLVEGSEPAGTLRRALAKRWGISGTVTVVGGGGDNAVAACGIGAMSEGQGFVSLGTSGVLLAAKDRFAPAPETAVHTFCHAIPDTWYQMGVILSATDSLNWLTRITGQSARDLAAEVGDDLTTPGAVGFAPYLSGERTPYNDSHIRGGFTGIGVDTTRADLTRAVMEGVAFALRDNLHALEGTGTDLKNVLAIGGGAQSTYWVELLATVLNLPIDLPEAGDFGAALGAARLAMMGADGASASDVMTPPPVARTITPNTDLRGAYDDAYARFRALYPALKALK
jgi:xylulokinase